MRWMLILLLVPLAGCLDATPSESGNTEPTTTAGPAGDMPGAPANASMWGSPDERPLRPGVNMLYDGASCTTSFIFHHESTFYMATAAHCVADGSPCDADRVLPDANATLLLLDGTEAHASVAYHSWTAMSERDESNGAACQYNDFALLQLAPEDVARAHPASIHFRAPTNLSIEAPSENDLIWGFGASILKQGVQESHPKRGTYLGTEQDGWSHHVYLATPGIPGDSGGHIMTNDGKALGIASTVSIAPVTGSNHYTDINKSLEYMREHLGWAPELVTWDDFNASLA